MVLSAEAFRVEFAAWEAAIVPWSVWIVSWYMSCQVFPVLETLVAMWTNVVPTLVWLMRSEVVCEVSLRAEGSIALAAADFAKHHIFFASTR